MMTFFWAGVDNIFQPHKHNIVGVEDGAVARSIRAVLKQYFIKRGLVNEIADITW